MLSHNITAKSLFNPTDPSVVNLVDTAQIQMLQTPHRLFFLFKKILFYIAPYSTEIALRCLTFKIQLKYILSSYRSNTFHT